MQQQKTSIHFLQRALNVSAVADITVHYLDACGFNSARQKRQLQATEDTSNHATVSRGHDSMSLLHGILISNITMVWPCSNRIQ